jgi:hypothetical protein
MAHFAKLDKNNIVTAINVVANEVLLDTRGREVEKNGIDFLADWSGGHKNWVQTSYNNNFRVRYAAVGDTYDPIRDAFIPPKPYPSWILNETTYDWDPPIPFPSDAVTLDDYIWNEDIKNWVRYTK